MDAFNIRENDKKYHPSGWQMKTFSMRGISFRRDGVRLAGGMQGFRRETHRDS
jgi:hypothetical protein